MPQPHHPPPKLRHGHAIHDVLRPLLIHCPRRLGMPVQSVQNGPLVVQSSQHFSVHGGTRRQRGAHGAQCQQQARAVVPVHLLGIQHCQQAVQGAVGGLVQVHEGEGDVVHQLLAGAVHDPPILQQPHQDILARRVTQSCNTPQQGVLHGGGQGQEVLVGRHQAQHLRLQVRRQPHGQRQLGRTLGRRGEGVWVAGRGFSSMPWWAGGRAFLPAAAEALDVVPRVDQASHHAGDVRAQALRHCVLHVRVVHCQVSGVHARAMCLIQVRRMQAACPCRQLVRQQRHGASKLVHEIRRHGVKRPFLGNPPCQLHVV